MKSDTVIAIVLTAGVLYLAWHIAMWATRVTEAGVSL